MAHHATVHPAVSSHLRGHGSREQAQGFLADTLAGFIDEAWLLIEDGDFLGLQHAASHLSSCARALGQGFIGDVAGMMAVSAAEQEAERCHLFLAVIQREWDTVMG
ncbi:hypothetical protein [Halomonas sp. 3H]|uniref:hypothetical protein n=1 Tax=Halomonas sp. 3H TaxID=2952527 RepID=UPI0020B897BD|nr:hypothetical protein [Halomonas sp. 3H]